MQLLTQIRPDTAHQGEAMIHPRFALWAASSDRRHMDHSQQNRATKDFCTSVSSRILQVPASSSWVAHVSSTTGEVISPLEKKKRMAQASLNSQREDKQRPSVIQCSQSPARPSSSRNSNCSDGSPVPSSSSSSRSPSPLSVSSEDAPTGSVNEPAPGSASPENSASTARVNEKNKPVDCDQASTDSMGQAKDVSQGSSQSQHADWVKLQRKDFTWKSYHKGTGKYFMPFHSSSSFATSTSSFSKVIPKSMQLLRPAPIRPGHKILPGRLLQQDTSLTCAKKPSSVIPWPYQTERRDRSRTMAAKIPPTQQSLCQSITSLPTSCVLTSYDKSGRDSRHQHPVHPAFLPHRMRLPQSPLMYHHVPVGPSQSTLIGPAVYPYHYPLHLLNPQVGYSLPAMNPIYPHKL